MSMFTSVRTEGAMTVVRRRGGASKPLSASDAMATPEPSTPRRAFKPVVRVNGEEHVANERTVVPRPPVQYVAPAPVRRPAKKREPVVTTEPVPSPAIQVIGLLKALAVKLEHEPAVKTAAILSPPTGLRVSLVDPNCGYIIIDHGVVVKPEPTRMVEPAPMPIEPTWSIPDPEPAVKETAKLNTAELLARILQAKPAPAKAAASWPTQPRVASKRALKKAKRKEVRAEQSEGTTKAPAEDPFKSVRSELIRRCNMLHKDTETRLTTYHCSRRWPNVNNPFSLHQAIATATGGQLHELKHLMVAFEDESNGLATKDKRSPKHKLR